MRQIVALVLIIFVVPLAGCGSLLASMGMGKIHDKPTERTMAQVIEDDNIETKVTVNLHADNEAYDKSHISVISYNGYVLLVGQVNDQILKDTATKLTRKVKGVRRIYNELEIGPPTTSLTRTSDAWITAKIKSLLLTHDSIRGTGVKVVTENGVVYLLGLVTTKEAALIADEAAGVSGVQRVVKLFEPID